MSWGQIAPALLHVHGQHVQNWVPQPSTRPIFASSCHSRSTVHNLSPFSPLLTTVLMQILSKRYSSCGTACAWSAEPSLSAWPATPPPLGPPPCDAPSLTPSAAGARRARPLPGTGAKSAKPWQCPECASRTQSLPDTLKLTCLRPLTWWSKQPILPWLQCYWSEASESLSSLLRVHNDLHDEMMSRVITLPCCTKCVSERAQLFLRCKGCRTKLRFRR